MKKISFLFVLLIVVNMFAGEVPKIFIHGHNSSGTNVKGWATWNHEDYYTSMFDIINIGYDGYIPNNPLNCEKNTYLSSTGGNKKNYL